MLAVACLDDRGATIGNNGAIGVVTQSDVLGDNCCGRCPVCDALRLKPLQDYDSITCIVGGWPRRMSAALAALYVGEGSVKSFRKRVGKEYPPPQVNEGRRQLWLIEDLNRAMSRLDESCGDAAADL